MKYKWLDGYLLNRPGAVKEFHESFQVDRYLVGGKMFAMWGGDKMGRPILTLKLDPLRGDDLRQQYPGEIVPGYYMNKLHWNSLYLEGDVPDELVKSMIDESYAILLNSLPIKARAAIMGEA
ncbi:DNA-binding protein [Deltaproteobacteria bacterium Smac51]|nr:DNA-binding protein [Deltaproteobacteria bacterium Smac51]